TLSPSKSATNVNNADWTSQSPHEPCCYGVEEIEVCAEAGQSAPQRHDRCVRRAELLPELCTIYNCLNMRLWRFCAPAISQQHVNPKCFRIALRFFEVMADAGERRHGLVVGADKQKTITQARRPPVGRLAAPAEPERDHATWTRVDPCAVNALEPALK